MPKPAPKSSPADATPAPEDLRVRRTRRLLAQALVELTRERPFESVTARELTEHAEIGYATFFRHYSSIESLLRSVVDDLLADLHELLPPLAGGDPIQAGTLIFRHAREHKEIYRLLLRTNRSLGLLNDAVQLGVASLQAAYEAKPDSHVPFEVAAHHFIHAVMNLLEWWLDHDMPYEPERMAEIYRDLILHPTETVALRRRSFEPPKGPA